MPAAARNVLSSPVFGDARIDQATAATSGGTNSGSMLAAAMKPLQGVLVRTTTHEKVSPMTTASAVPPAQAISELASAACTLGLPSTVTKLAKRKVEDAKSVHHRIGVGERAQQQHRDRVGDQEGQEQQQPARPHPGEQGSAPHWRTDRPSTHVGDIGRKRGVGGHSVSSR